jgi:glycosyltransferase involved in cell wall biosynthesis
MPIISVTIPTYNRSIHLKNNLEKLVTECNGINQNLIEIIVSDNDSTDDTAEVVNEAISKGLNIRYIRNEKNIGSDANFAQCFNLATGKYVLIMGDDDQFTTGAISSILKQLEYAKDDYGVVFLKAYAFEHSAELELPHSENKTTIYETEDFLQKIGHQLTFISSMLINKSLIKELDAMQFCGGQLVQVYLVLRAALQSKRCLYMSRYILACIRSSSPAFDYGKVFVLELGRILDEHQEYGLSPGLIKKIENNATYKLLTYLALRQRLANVGDPKKMYQQIATRYKSRFIFEFGLGPILRLPRFLAIAYGVVAVFIGRAISGDLSRAFWLIWNQFKLPNKKISIRKP